MSKIERLSVVGVRNFGPVERQTIKFSTPLTLIVGYNGSGKTTIIECLKYATTGELPPNSKGGAFIHDPKLAGESEVRAQVKLQYTTPPDAVHVVTRSLQLTLKRTQRTQKTLEGSLSTWLDGERSTLSKKGADLDHLIPDHLGVGAAILDSVIFCHQDESLWPMSEPSALKKKFDEIFEALKYTKAIENLKLIRKKKGEELRSLKNDEGHRKADKDKADRCEKQCIKIQDDIEELRDKCNLASEQIEEADKNAKEMHEKKTSSLSIVNDLSNRKQQIEYRQSTLDETRSRMDELDESDSWLQNTLAQYEERAERLQHDYEENKSQYSGYVNDLSGARNDLSDRLSEHGKHKSDKEKYERQLESRVKRIHQAAQAHGIRGFDGDLDDGQIEAFRDRMQRILGDKKKDLDRLQNDNAEESDKLGAAITELEGRKSQYTQDRTFAKQRIHDIERQVKQHQQQLALLDVDESTKAMLDSSFQDVQQRLEKAAQELRDTDLDSKIQSENNQLLELENTSSKLSRELVECTRLADEQSKLNYRKEELGRKKQMLSSVMNSQGQKLTALVGQWEPSSAEQQFQQALQLKSKALDEANQKRNEKLQESKQIQRALSGAKDTAKARQDEMQQCKAAVLKALSTVNPEDEAHMDGLADAIRDIESEVDNGKKQINLGGEMKKYYAGCKVTLENAGACELCERKFANEREKARIQKKIQKVLDEDIETVKGQLAAAESDLAILRAVVPRADTYERLQGEKPAHDRKTEEDKAAYEDAVRELEELDEAVRTKQEDRQDLESLGKAATEISRLHVEVAEAEAQVERVMSQQQSSVTTRSADEINQAQDSCAEQTRAVKHNIERLTGDRQRLRDSVHSLEVEKSQQSNKVSEVVRKLERKGEIQKQIGELKNDKNAQREAIAKADKDLESVVPEISSARADRQAAVERGRAKEKRVADERDNIGNSVHQLKMIDDSIQDYIDRGGPSLLASNEKAIGSIKQNISRIEKDMNDLTARTNKLKEEISNSSGNKKNIVDNLHYRKTLREIEKLQQEIEELESRNAGEDYERYREEAENWDFERDKLNAERGTMIGTAKQLDNELKRLTKEYEVEYQDAARIYRETHIKVETTKAAIEDLGRYSEALNNAIMKYHSMKMAEVNQIAGDLWRQAYQGTDIDTIMIKSDSESATGRSSYNYRVVMVKQDTEMDMRGRCSAGQKVLASIIIRLALAESFGVNCGIIALDEPTTNLDRENIRSLASSLHDIIRQRRAQSNFQLIVITHDEEFLRHMRVSDFCDDYARVKRDERQNSVIKMESISQVI